jgi:hypothetical protein
MVVARNSGRERKREREGPETNYIFPGNASNDLLPQAGLHLLNFPPPLKWCHQLGTKPSTISL